MTSLLIIMSVENDFDQRPVPQDLEEGVFSVRTNKFIDNYITTNMKNKKDKLHQKEDKPNISFGEFLLYVRKSCRNDQVIPKCVVWESYKDCCSFTYYLIPEEILKLIIPPSSLDHDILTSSCRSESLTAKYKEHEIEFLDSITKLKRNTIGIWGILLRNLFFRRLAENNQESEDMFVYSTSFLDKIADEVSEGLNRLFIVFKKNYIRNIKDTYFINEHCNKYFPFADDFSEREKTEKIKENQLLLCNYLFELAKKNINPEKYFNRKNIKEQYITYLIFDKKNKLNLLEYLSLDLQKNNSLDIDDIEQLYGVFTFFKQKPLLKILYQYKLIRKEQDEFYRKKWKSKEKFFEEIEKQIEQLPEGKIELQKQEEFKEKICKAICGSTEQQFKEEETKQFIVTMNEKAKQFFESLTEQEEQFMKNIKERKEEVNDKIKQLAEEIEPQKHKKKYEPNKNKEPEEQKQNVQYNLSQ